MVRLVVTIEIAAAAAGLVAFVVMYARRDWRGTREGRHVMFFTAALALLLIMWLASRLTIVLGWLPDGLPQWAWAVALAGLPVAAWWRVALLWRRQHEKAHSD
jgi:hypothetical protein